MPNETTPGTVIISDGEPDLDAIAAKHVVPEGANRPWAAPGNGAAEEPAAPTEPAAEAEAAAEAPAAEPEAPETPAAAPAAAPAPAAPQKRERLAPMLRKEKELREQEASLKAREAEIAAKARQAVLDELGAEPAKLLQEAKLTPSQLAQRLVKPEAVRQANPVAKELDELKATVQALKAERDAREAAETQAEMVRELTELVKEDATRWPLLNQTGEHEAVAAEMLTYYEKTGQVLGDDEAADRVEAKLAGLRAKMLGQTGARPADKPATAKTATRTTSNQGAASQPAGRAQERQLPEDDDDAIAVIAARADRRLAEARAARK